MRDEILLSRDYYAESINKVLQDNLDDKDIRTVTKIMVITVMSVFAAMLEDKLFGTEEDG